MFLASRVDQVKIKGDNMKGYKKEFEAFISYVFERYRGDEIVSAFETTYLNRQIELGCRPKKRPAEKRVIISTDTADLCQKLVGIEIERDKVLNIYPKGFKMRLERAKNELAGNYVNINNLRELLKRINDDGRRNGCTN